MSQQTERKFEPRKHEFRWKRRLLQLVVVSVALLLAMSMTAKRPENLGLVGGKLGPCPTSPNCVSSTAERESQRLPPIEFEGPPNEAFAKLVSVVSSYPRARIIHQREDYLLVEFKSLLFRFTDDVEFLLDSQNQKIDFRSASRVGYSDMGANRKRMISLTNKFSQQTK